MAKTSLYTWTQTEDLVSISFGVKHAVLTKPGSFDLFTSRSYVKLHIKSPRLFAEFDLLQDIKPISGQTRVVSTDIDVTLHLEKAVIGETWSELVCRNKAEAMRRRQESLKEREEAEKEATNAKRDVEIKLDRFAIQEQMRIEGIQRNEIEFRKDQERLEAESQLYSSLPSYTPSVPSSSAIFDDSIAIRPSFSQQIPFTPKPVPTMATRETQFKEPPKPKTLKELQGPAYDFHPVWIKAKADALFNNGDFGSAINAYSEVIKAEPGNIPALLNRSASYLKLSRVPDALRDLLSAEETKHDQPHFTTLITLRKSVILAWKGQYAEAIDGFKAAMTNAPGLDLSADIRKIEVRRESNKVKAEGDGLYRRGELTLAGERYRQAVEIDPDNEVALANLAQIALKVGESAQAVDYCKKALPLAVLNPRLQTKLLVRLAKAVRGENLGEARKALEQALAIDPENQSILRMSQQIQNEVTKAQYDSQKQEADSRLRSGNPTEALHLYKDLIITTRDREARAAIYTNMCACHLMLKQYFDVVSTAERGLQLNPSNPVRLRLLSRRANAYSALGQVHSAILDVRQALTLEPENDQLKTELEILIQSARRQ